MGITLQLLNEISGEQHQLAWEHNKSLSFHCFPKTLSLFIIFDRNIQFLPSFQNFFFCGRVNVLCCLSSFLPTLFDNHIVLFHVQKVLKFFPNTLCNPCRDSITSSIPLSIHPDNTLRSTLHKSYSAFLLRTQD